MPHEKPLLANRTTVNRWPWLLLMLSFLAFSHASLGQEPPDTNYDESKVPEYELPDPLVCFDGRPVSDAAMWRETRRPEILQAFADHVYGRTPEIKTHLRFETVAADARVFDGLATRKQIRIRLLEAGDAPWIDLLLYVPIHTNGLTLAANSWRLCMPSRCMSCSGYRGWESPTCPAWIDQSDGPSAITFALETTKSHRTTGGDISISPTGICAAAECFTTLTVIRVSHTRRAEGPVPVNVDGVKRLIEEVATSHKYHTNFQHWKLAFT